MRGSRELNARSNRPMQRGSMAKRSKEPRRVIRRVTPGRRRWLVAPSAPWMRGALGPVAAYLDMLFVDHGVLRLIYLNRHRLGERAWRSAQPAPNQIRALARHGIRTIVNLRGERQCGSYRLERDACRRYGIDLVDFKIRSRIAPRREDLKKARDLFECIQYPMLIHCKTGADRVGLMSVLYLFLKEGVPIEQARKQLSLRYGHLRQSRTGILDYFFERYLEDTTRRPMPFFEWVDTVYDPEELERAFQAAARRMRLRRCFW
jgi:protein tyrosine/serine phosphatase